MFETLSPNEKAMSKAELNTQNILLNMSGWVMCAFSSITAEIS